MTRIRQAYGTSDELVSETWSNILGRTIQSRDDRGVISYNQYDADGRVTYTFTRGTDNKILTSSWSDYTPDGQNKLKDSTRDHCMGPSPYEL